MNRTYEFAEKELNILDSTVEDAIISPFREQILALCQAFGESGQSGGSAPYTAKALSMAVEKLCLFEPICDVTGCDDEWVEVTYSPDRKMWQNSRCGALFKYEDGDCWYGEAIVWSGEEDYDRFTGSVYIDDIDFQLIRSSQKVRFPFKPRTFYVDVVRVPISKEVAEKKRLHYIEDGFNKCYYTILKDKTQLDEVFKHYIK